jgi:hypothetical protein
MYGITLGFAALVIAVVTTVTWFRAALGLRLPRNRTPWVVGWAVSVGLGLAALSQGAGWLGGVPAVLAMIAGAFLLFTIGISAQQVAPDAVVVGSSLPEFDALDDSGERFALSSLAGGPLLLKFFRGHW